MKIYLIDGLQSFLNLIVLVLFSVTMSCTGQKSEITEINPSQLLPGGSSDQVNPPEVTPPPPVVVDPSDYAKVKQFKSVAAGNSGTQDQSLTFDNPVSSGNTIIVFAQGSVYLSSTIATTITDDQGNIYTQISYVEDQDDNGAQGLYTFVAENVSGGALTVSSDWNGTFNNYRGVFAIEIENVTPDSYINNSTAVQTVVNGVVDSIFTPAVSIAEEEVLILSYTFDTYFALSSSVGTGFSLEGYGIFYDAGTGGVLQSRRITTSGNYQATHTPLANTNHITSTIYLKEKAH